MKYRIVPITGKAALAWIAKNHRHLPDVPGALFGVAVAYGEAIVGVGITGRGARVWEGTGRIIISRVATLDQLEPVGIHAAPACSMIYGALCRASAAMGYVEAWTYSLPGEDGRSIRAAGFEYMGKTRAESWDRKDRPRSTVNAESKGRWRRKLIG